MTTTRRRAPLHADPIDGHDDGVPDPAVHAAPPPPSDADLAAIDDAVHHPDLLTQSTADRRAFAEAVHMLRTGGQSLNFSERTLMVVAGVITPFGLLLVLLGWRGASRTPNVFEQVPYMISGGMLGLGLIFLGAFFYFAHWITELVKESRSGTAALLEAVTRLQDTIVQTASSNGNGPVSDNGHANLVATLRGAMAHRLDCAVVAGKDDLRSVTLEDDLAPCKMCEPYTDVDDVDASA